VGEAKRRVGALLEELVHKAQVAGKMRSDVSAEDLPPLFMGMVMASPPGLSPARQARYVQIILDGLRYQGTHEPE
jgi:hypothetical protein